MHNNSSIEIQDCVFVTRETEAIPLSAGAREETVWCMSVAQEVQPFLDTSIRTFQFLHFNKQAASPPAGLTAPQQEQ